MKSSFKNCTVCLLGLSLFDIKIRSMTAKKFQCGKYTKLEEIRRGAHTFSQHRRVQMARWKMEGGKDRGGKENIREDRKEGGRQDVLAWCGAGCGGWVSG